MNYHIHGELHWQMNSKQILAAVTFIGISTMTTSALANTIDAIYAGSANFGSGGVGYENGSIAPNPDSNTSLVSVGIGGDSFTTSNLSYNFSNTGQFNAWCIDIYDWMSSGTVTYNVDTGSDLAVALNSLRPGSPSGATRVSQLLELADEDYSSVHTETQSAAFQLAVWAIAFGIPDGSGHYQINMTDPDLHVDSGTASSAYGALANTWLDDLGTAPSTEDWTLTYLSDGTQGNTQNVIVFTDPTTVPEPTSLALLGLGLGGLAFGRRKRTWTVGY